MPLMNKDSDFTMGASFSVNAWASETWFVDLGVSPLHPLQGKIAIHFKMLQINAATSQFVMIHF